MVLIFVRSSRIADQGVCPDQARISDRTKKEKNAAPEFFALPVSHACIGIRLGFWVFRVWWVLFLVGLLFFLEPEWDGERWQGRKIRLAETARNLRLLPVVERSAIETNRRQKSKGLGIKRWAP